MDNEEIERLARTLFVYVKDGRVKCVSITEAKSLEQDESWEHTATIDPAVIIERMANGPEDPSDVLDELQFTDND